MKVLIVGGVAGGASAAARLRRLNEDARIILFERGEYISFANCGLPYYIGGEIKEKSALTLQTPQSFRGRFNVDVRIRSEVIRIDRESKTVTVSESQTGRVYTESYDKLILSMGAEPVRPPVEGINSDRVFTLRNIPDTYKIKEYIEVHKPRSAVVVGAGYIGIEMAENLQRAGLDVTVVEKADKVIGPLDYDMACEVQAHIRSKGVRLYLNEGVTGIHRRDNGLEVRLDTRSVQADMLIMAVGVKPETGIAVSAGLQVNERKFILTDRRMLTSDQDIYAVGDAVAVEDFITGDIVSIPLAGPANKQGRIAADNICGLAGEYKGTQGSAILKVFDMTVATTGINERTAAAKGIPYEKSFTYSACHASYYPGAVNMSVKTVFDRNTGKILGAQVVGYEGADKRCDVLATAIRAGMTAGDLAELELCYAPPYSSAKDPVNMAGFVIQNILSGLDKIFHWHDIEKLPKDGSVILLDTRTPMEYMNGHIDGFINIPLDSLRSRLNELDKSKKVYVTCQIGLRGYVACRILAQNGFDCFNLSGGYRLYRSIFGNTELPLPEKKSVDPETQRPEEPKPAQTLRIDACGLQCPGPILKLSEAIRAAERGALIEISTTDPAFAMDIEAFCRRTGNGFEGMTQKGGVTVANIRKTESACLVPESASAKDGKNIIVFSGDLDKAIASFIIANTAASLGRKVSMFFTFWGLNILRRPEKVSVKKDMVSAMFGKMMPKGSKKLSLSKMNMGGVGAKMIRGVMGNKNISSLEDLIKTAQKNGVELVACSMSMDVMGIRPEELIDGIKMGGAASMIAHGEESDMSLFI